MKLYKILLAAGLALCAVVACKEDEDETTYKSMTGTLEVASIDAYTNPGDTYELEATGVALPESETDESIEIVYTIKVGSETADTVASKTVVIPDTLGTFTVVVSAAATGYYTKTVTLSTEVVSARSLTNTGREDLTPDFTDSRDSKKYFTKAIAGKTWFTQNLAYFEKDSEGNYTLGRPYYSAKATEDIMGGFYTWNDAQNACPSGWRLPTSDEWDALAENAGDIMSDAYYNGSKLWEFWPEVKITNSTGFSAYPFGYATIVDDVYTFYGFGDYCYYWVDNSGSPMCRSIYVKDPDIKVWGSPSATDFAAQVRCIK